MSIKISELPAATSVGNNDVLPIVQSGTTKKAAASLLKTSISSTINSSSTNDTAAGAKAVYDYSAPISHSTSATTYGVGTESNYGHCKTINNLTTASYVAGEALSAYQGKVLDEAKEDVANKTNTIDENSTSTQYPNAEATYQAISTLEGNLSAEIIDLQAENEALRNQIPTYTATGTSINVKDSSNLPIKDFALLGNASQNGTPTPDSPVPIQVVTGDNTLYFTGKNMLNITTLTNSNKWTYSSGLPSDVTNSSRITINSYDSNNMNFTINSNNYLMIFIDEIKLKPNTQYTISYKRTDSISGKQRNYIWTKESTTYTQVATSSTDTTNISMTFTTSSSGIIAFGIGVTNTAEDDIIDVKNIQLEQNSTATDFEPYQAQTQLISLGDIELAKIGTYQDRIYKDNGKWYKEEIIRKDILNGTENWDVRNTGTENWFYFRGINSRQGAAKVLSNLYPYNGEITNSNTLQGISLSYATSTSSTIKIRYGTEDTIDNFKTFLSTNNLVTYAVMKFSTTTEITDTTLIQQLDNVLAMSTYKNETNAFSIVASGNEEGEMQIEYYQDIATLFNNLSNAILSLGNNT